MCLEKNMIQKDTCTSVFIAALLTIARHGNNPTSMDRGIDKMCSIYTMEYSSAIEKKEIMPFAPIGMDLDIVILSEARWRKRNMILHICCCCCCC